MWFHAHARGINRHAGRLHYRMEYLARKSDNRVQKRSRVDVASENAMNDNPDQIIKENDDEDNIDENVK